MCHAAVSFNDIKPYVNQRYLDLIITQNLTNTSDYEIFITLIKFIYLLDLNYKEFYLSIDHVHQLMMRKEKYGKENES